MLTLDHGTVFYDNTTPSPYPTRLHLWLLALGMQVRFTRKRCPTDGAGSRLNQSRPDGGVGADAHLAHLSISPPLFTRGLEAT